MHSWRFGGSLQQLTNVLCFCKIHQSTQPNPPKKEKTGKPSAPPLAPKTSSKQQHPPPWPSYGPPNPTATRWRFSKASHSSRSATTEHKTKSAAPEPWKVSVVSLLLGRFVWGDIVFALWHFLGVALLLLGGSKAAHWSFFLDSDNSWTGSLLKFLRIWWKMM